MGLATPEELCAHAKRSGYGSLALTDINGTYGYLEFHLAAKKHGIKPIYGSIVYHTSLVDPGSDRFRIVLLAISHEGLRNVAALTSLSAIAHESGIALSLEQFRDYAAGVVVLVGNVRSEVGARVLAGDDKGAEKSLITLKDIFTDNIYVEIQDHGEKGEKQLAQKLLTLAEDSRVAPAFTQEIHYTGAEMRRVYGLLTGIRRPHEKSDFFKIDQRDAERSMRSESEMQHFFSIYPQAYKNAYYISERIPLDLFAHVDHPSALLKRLDDSEQSFLERCTDGFRKRYKKLTESELARYESVIQDEVREITQAGLISTFLLYRSIIARLRRAGITLGPATGVSLQSLCAYVLGITSYDPYVYDDRFHPMLDSRLESMTELEIQLTSDARENAVKLLRDMIGERSFAYVPAVERITPTRAIRMVSGVVEIGENDIEEVLKITSRHPGIPIKELSEEDRKLGWLFKRSAPVRELLTRASLLEGLPSGFIRSRRSVAFSAVPLTDYFAQSIDGETGDLFIHAGRELLPVEPFLRIDFTPLNALSVDERVEKELERDGVSYEWERFPRSDRMVWQEIQSGDTTGVFLFDGPMVQQQRESFELKAIGDLTNLLALLRYRGDEGNLADRIKSFQKGEIFSGSDPPEILRILRGTRGHIMYDEQLRDILAVLADTDSVEALSMLQDARAIDPGTLARMRGRFMRAMADKDVPVESAATWFERVLFYSKQTIRRERVLADAILVYKMFYVKVYHPGVFHAALLNSNLENESRLQKYLGHLDNRGVVLPLDVNHSGHLFESVDGQVRVGFCAVAGLDKMAINRIIKTRGKGRFRSMDDFVKKTRGKGVDDDAIRKLVEAGAFDAMGERDVLLDCIEKPAPKRRFARKPKPKAEGQMEIPFDTDED